MDKNIIKHLERMIQMIEKIERYSVGIETYEQFIADEKNVDLCIVPLIQIGEIAGSMSKIYQIKPDIPYKEIVGFRNILVHTYHKVETKALWRIITKNIPILKIKIQEFYDQNNY